MLILIVLLMLALALLLTPIVILVYLYLYLYLYWYTYTAIRTFILCTHTYDSTCTLLQWIARAAVRVESPHVGPRVEPSASHLV